MNECLYLLKAEDTGAVLLGQDSDHDPVTRTQAHTHIFRSFHNECVQAAAAHTLMISHHVSEMSQMDF